MQLSRTYALLLSAGSMLALSGCGDISVEPIRAKAPAGVSPVFDSDDPYACELVRNDQPLTHYAGDGFDSNCKATGNWCLRTGSRSFATDLETGEVSVHQEFAMVCQEPCQVDSDCPAPESGTAVASCFFFHEPSPENPVGTCIVRCDSGERCQDGFECHASLGHSDYAVWPATCFGKPVSVSYSYIEPSP
jgi:hypothetical protein